MALLLHSPGDIIRRLLIDESLGADPPSEDWPVYADGNLPSEPDQVITVNTTQGVDFGSTQVDGLVISYYGFQVLVRSRRPYDGYSKADAIRDHLARTLFRRTLTLTEPSSLAATSYLVWCAAQIGQVLRLGKESPTSQRWMFSINAVAPIIPQ